MIDLISKSEHNNLLNKYNRVVSEVNGLRDQLKQNKDKMQERESVIKIEMDLVRKLCEEILAKDPAEMVIGSEYSWSQLPLRVLIERTSESYRKYNAERTSLLLRISDIAEERAIEIESLQEQISQMQVMAAERGTPVTVEEAQREIAEKQFVEEATKNATLDVKNAIEKGTCEIIYSEDEDVTDETIHAAAEALKINASAKLTASSVPVSDSREKIESFKKEKQRIEEINKPHMINLADYQKKMTDIMEITLNVVGQKGISVFGELEDAIAEECKEKNISYSTSRIRSSYQSLIQMGILESSDKFGTALRPSLRVIRFSVLGHRFYKEKYGKSPVISEWDRIIREHDNLVHGYSILELARVMEKSPYYKNVTCENHRKPIPLKDGLSYVPDVIGQTERHTDYIEYEFGNHIQPEFDVKMNKLILVTKYINFIVPNKEILNLMGKKLTAWSKNKSNQSLKNYKIRISTMKYFAEHEPGSPKSWQQIWNLSTGEVIDNNE